MSTDVGRTEREDKARILETELATSSSCIFQSDSFLQQQAKEKNFEICVAAFLLKPFLAPASSSSTLFSPRQFLPNTDRQQVGSQQGFFAGENRGEKRTR